MKLRAIQRAHLVIAVLLLTLGASIPLSAQHIAGVRISRTGNNASLTVDVDITVFHWSGDRTTTGLGIRVFSTFFGEPFTVTVRDAINWGDGSVVTPTGAGLPLVATSTVVNGVPVRAYRGSFSHTYGSPGHYRVNAWSQDGARLIYNYTSGGNGYFDVSVVTGNGAYIHTDSYPAYYATFASNILDISVGSPVFVNGFESGNFSAWSRVVPRR